MIRTKMVNGKSQPLTSAENAARGAEESAMADQQSAQDRVAYRSQRRDEMPDHGDQLDELMKFVESMKAAGTPLPASMDKMLTDIADVKARHPKPA